MSSFRWVCGFHAVEAVLKRPQQQVLKLVCTVRDDERLQAIRAFATGRDVPVQIATVSELNAQIGGAVSHQGVCAYVRLPVLAHHLEDVLEQLGDQPPLLLVLDGLQDPHNLGACLRTADALGAHAVIAPKDRAVGLTTSAVKVACGAAETVPYFAVTNLARTLHQLSVDGVGLFGTSADAATQFIEHDYRGPTAWVLGSEDRGLRRLTRERCDTLVRIPMYGYVDCLNVSVTAGICLAEAQRQRALAIP